MQVDKKQATDAANTERIRPMVKENTGSLPMWKIGRSVPPCQRGAGKTVWNAR
jgi:hypothetical protein